MNKLLQNIFSVLNVGIYKVWTILGIKIKHKNFNEILGKIQTDVNSLQTQINSNQQEILKLLNLLKKIDIKRKIEWNSPGVWNCYGGNFKEYIINNNMQEKIKLLKANLDEKSCNLIDVLYKRLVVFPDLDDYDCFSSDFVNVQKKFQIKEEILTKNAYNQEKPSYAKKYTFSSPYGFNCDVFYTHHGLRFMNKAIHNYIKGKDFIDGGAFIGDSAILLNEYSPNKIISFEIVDDFCKKYHENMKLNNISEDKYEIINKGLFSNNSKTEIKINESFSQRSSLTDRGEIEISLTSIDNIVKEKNLNVGFIKLDIEGAELAALMGGGNTINKYKPVLSIAIYHNPIQFFELKSQLEEITKNLDYKFHIMKLEGNVYHPLIETVLFAYPSSILDIN